MRCWRHPARPMLHTLGNATAHLKRLHLVRSGVAGVGSSVGSGVLNVPSSAPRCSLLALEVILRLCNAVCSHLPGVLVSRPCAMHTKRLSAC